VLQARKWGWKRVAARLLLIPVLAGGTAATATAQTRTPAGGQPAAGPVMTPAAGRATDPKQLLKDGRKALAESRFNDAQDLARAAAANNPSGKWGLFDDTPNALLKDVEAARAKANKAEAEKLMKEAKTLLGKPAANDAERAYNLDNALQMARKADQLHGPYSVWDVGDRPDKLVKDVEAARAKLHVSPVAPPQNGAMAKNGPAGQPMASAQPPAPKGGVRPAGAPPMPIPQQPSGVVQAGGPKPPTGQPQAPAAPDAKKVAALKLMAEGNQLADQGQFVAAQAKYLEAERIGATFSVNEPNPGFARQQLNVRGSATITVLVREANDRMAKKDYEKANASLVAASEIARGLGLFDRPIEEAKAALRTASNGKYGGSSSVALNPGGGTPEVVAVGPGPVAPPMPKGPAQQPGPVAPVQPRTPTNPVAASPMTPPVVNPVNPVAANPMTPPAANPVTPPAAFPPGTATVSGPARAVQPAAGAVTGRQLLDQAELALKSGDLDVASTLARQAYNQGMQAEASGLLNTIDAEKLAMKQRTASKSFDAAVAAHANKDYGQALGVLVLIDPKLLPPEKAAKHVELVAVCRAEQAKIAGMGTEVVATAGMQDPGMTPPLAPAVQPMTPAAQPMTPPVAQPAPSAPGTARVGTGAQPDPNNLATQADAMRRITFQKLRNDSLKVQADAQAAFGRGETDVAIQMLVDYANRVRTSELEPASVALLLRPIESRLEMFRVMKGQADALARERKDKQNAKELIVGRGAAEEQRKAEVQRLVRECNRYIKAQDFAMAEKVALQAKTLDPDNEAVAMLAQMTKMQRRVKDAEKLKDDKERMVLNGLNSAEQPGPFVDTQDPVAIQVQRSMMNRGRGSLDDSYLRPRSPEEYRIELQLDNKISIEFNQTPLELAIENLRTVTGLPIMFEYPAIESEGLSTAKPVTVKPGSAISVKNLLHVTLEQAGMGFVIEHDMIKITTIKRSKGRLFTKVFSVADLVTPIPNFALPDYANLDKMLNKNPLNSGNVQLGGGGGPTPFTGPGSLPNGAPAGTMPGLNPGISGTIPFAPGGSLQTSPVGAGNGPNPLSASVHLAPERNTKQEQLIKLITGMVRPYSWDGMGGPGRIEYYDIGSALVVNQTADVIAEVANLLEALRRLQDLAVAVEIRIISLSETFYERMGMDFAVNVKTNSNTAKFEPQLTSGIFRPEPFINDISVKGVTVGLTPAGAGGSGGSGVGPNFTPDLDVPIRATSFQYAIPPFGGYPQSPGFNGGVSLGLAFLNDIQVYMFMEAAQGDRRANIMQAPKLTLFNGQTATLAVTAQSFFVTNVAVVSVNGQLVFVPNNTPLPGPDTNFTIAVQAVVSADRRFVRLNLPITMAAETGATVPLFPITTFITPVFEGGSQGVPIPFTQFLQQPGFTTLTISTTVVCPDGGTVLLGGLKTLKEGRNEFGPPFLSKIPYVNRLFKNVGIGRETTHIMIMVTPRIIINAEEEVNQTEGRQFGTVPGGP
jgi:Flp pilus assembly secretin CpaC/tetratricopeptide (TPR) repeat protein